MITVRKVIKPVYYGGRKARLTRKRAYLDAAWLAWCEKHPCKCPGECREHVMVVGPFGARLPEPKRKAYRKKAIERLARWLMWRDGR